MKNIQIVAEGKNYIVVKADTKRFGKNEVMFEGNTFDQCFDYIRRMCGVEHFNLISSILYEPYTDRAGRTFPCFMKVELKR